MEEGLKVRAEVGRRGNLVDEINNTDSFSLEGRRLG